MTNTPDSNEALERRSNLEGRLASRQQNHRRETVNNDLNGAPERIRLVKRYGLFDGRWYYPDAAIMPFDTEIEYVPCASVAAVEGDALPRQEVVARIEKQIRLWNNDTVTMALADVLADLKSIPAAALSPAPAEPLQPTGEHGCLVIRNIRSR